MGGLARTGRLASAVAAAVLGAAACSVSIDLEGDATGSAEPGPEVTTGEPVAVGASDLDVGDCVAGGVPEQDAADVEQVDTLPCDTPHGGEVYALLDLEGEAYPGDVVVTTQADEACLARFADFVGIAWERSRLEYWFYTPSPASWETGDREVACLVSDPTGPMTGSAAGLGEAAVYEGPAFTPWVGACLDTAYAAVDCTVEHDSEVYSVLELPEADWPGDEEAATRAEDACLVEFHAYVGRPYEESVLSLFYYSPTETMWAAGDRDVWCLVEHPEGSLTGSVRGTAQ